MTRSSDLTLTSRICNLERTVSFPGWQGTGMMTATSKETGMIALEYPLTNSDHDWAYLFVGVGVGTLALDGAAGAADMAPGSARHNGGW